MGSFVIRYWDKKFFIFHASWATRNHILTWVLTWVAIELLVKWRDLKIHKQLWRINRIILYTLRFENIYFLYLEIHLEIILMGCKRFKIMDICFIKNNYFVETHKQSISIQYTLLKFTRLQGGKKYSTLKDEMLLLRSL